MASGHGQEHGHGHEHGHHKMELPDYKQWKIEGTPLQTVQEKLAARGLRDPWGRVLGRMIGRAGNQACRVQAAGTEKSCDPLEYNEAWRYMGEFASNVSFVGALLRGFKWGFAAFVVAVGAEYLLESQNKEKKHH